MALILGERAALASVHNWLTNCTMRIRVQTTTLVTIDVIIPRLLSAASRCGDHGLVNRPRALRDMCPDYRCGALLPTRARCRDAFGSLMGWVPAKIRSVLVPSQADGVALLRVERPGALAKAHWRAPPMPQYC